MCAPYPPFSPLLEEENIYSQIIDDDNFCTRRYESENEVEHRSTGR